MEQPAPASTRVTEAHCLHLRHKGMYVTSVPDPGEEQHCGGPYDATAYWCVRTLKGFGPDGEPVRADRCAQGRACCEH